MGVRQWISGSLMLGAVMLTAASVQARSASLNAAYAESGALAQGEAPLLGGVKPIRRDEVQSVPEPATGVLVIAGGLTLAARQWLARRNSKGE